MCGCGCGGANIYGTPDQNMFLAFDILRGPVGESSPCRATQNCLVHKFFARGMGKCQQVGEGHLAQIRARRLAFKNGTFDLFEDVWRVDGFECRQNVKAVTSDEPRLYV